MRWVSVLAWSAAMLALGFSVAGVVALGREDCILPGTIREVEVNGVTWRGEPIDSGVGVRYAKPVKGKD